MASSAWAVWTLAALLASAASASAPFSVVSAPESLAIFDRLGTKSPYPFSLLPNPPTDALKDRSTTVDNCTLSSVYVVSRHGTRFPTGGDISKFAALAAALSTSLPLEGVDPNLAFLRNWTNPYDPLRPSYLAAQGEQDLFGIGSRFRKEYSSFLEKKAGPYDALTFDFRSTQLSRTGQSASAFIQGLFTEKGSLRVSDKVTVQPAYVYTVPRKEDSLLRGFENCPAYVDQVTHTGAPQAAIESEIYAAKYMDGILSRVSKKTGGRLWTRAEVETAFKVCAFEVSLNHDFDSFCALFEDEDVLHLEYLIDIEDYYELGYGVSLSGLVACPILSEVLSSSSSPEDTLVRVRLAHDQTVTTLSVLLGLHRDDFALTGNLSSDKIANRKWRMGQVAPFATNLIFESLECPTSSLYQRNPAIRDQLRGTPSVDVIRVRKNEKDIVVPACPAAGRVNLLDGSTACLVNVWNSRFTCQFDKVCSST